MESGSRKECLTLAGLAPEVARNEGNRPTAPARDPAFGSLRDLEQSPPGARLDNRPENLPQPLERVESAPGIAMVPEATNPEQYDVLSLSRVRHCDERSDEASQRPENPAQGLENVESAPENFWAAEAPTAVSPAFLSAIGLRPLHVRVPLNAVAAS